VTIDVRVLRADEGSVLDDVAADVFDHAIDPRWCGEFFADPRHHLAVALDGGRVVGMASAVHYVHPDKAPELWVNEVGVAPTHHGQGIGRRLLQALFAHGTSLGCATAWVLTDRSNVPAMRLYHGAGGKDAPGDLVMIDFALPGAR
jgi:GNAT superfamily N-acetyltransferase